MSANRIRRASDADMGTDAIPTCGAARKAAKSSPDSCRAAEGTLPESIGAAEGEGVVKAPPNNENGAEDGRGADRPERPSTATRLAGEKAMGAPCSSDTTLSVTPEAIERPGIRSILSNDQYGSPGESTAARNPGISTPSSLCPSRTLGMASAIRGNSGPASLVIPPSPSFATMGQTRLSHAYEISSRRRSRHFYTKKIKWRAPKFIKKERIRQ